MDRAVRAPIQLGAIIQDARRRQGMTQQQLASLIGLQQKTISAIENDSAGTKLDTLFRIFGALDLDIKIVSGRMPGKSIEDVF